MLFKVALASLFNRKLTVLLTIFSLTISVIVMLGVEHIRDQAKDNFSQTVSGVDLIVGARTGQINLLLYSVFHIGNATNNIAWTSFEELSKLPQTKWAIPISLGDSHKGYRVIGTSDDFFTYFKYGQKQMLKFEQGHPFNQVYDAVLGADVAKKLHYKLNETIILSHGAGNVSFIKHSDKPFKVVGILAATGTPIDQSIQVPLAGIEAIHIDWHDGGRSAIHISAKQALTMDLTPKAITAFFVGLNSKFDTFSMQRSINNYQEEPLMAILPGVALSELWQMMNGIEKVLSLISALVLAASLLGMCTMLLASMNARSRELAMMRTIGATGLFILTLVEIEALIITLTSILLACALLYFGLHLLQPWIISHYGVVIDADIFSQTTLIYLSIMILASLILALLPAISAYRLSLSKGLMAN